MPLYSNNQQHFATIGARVFFKRDDHTVSGTTTQYPMLDLGLLGDAPAPALASQKIEIRDPYYNNNIIGIANPQVDETYALQCQNLSPQNLALYFLSNPPTDLTVTGAAAVDVAQPVAVVGRTDGGGYIKILDAAGNPVYNLASVDSVKMAAGVTTLVANDDYVVDDLDFGIIRLIPGGTAAMTDGQAITDLTVGYTTSSQSGYRIINPQSQRVIEGVSWIIAREEPGAAYVRECRGNLSPDSATFQVNALSNAQLTLTVLADTAQTNATQTFGRLVQVMGDVASNVRI